jgi:hypothetical protein
LFISPVTFQPWATIYNKNTDYDKNIWIDMNCGANGLGNTKPDPITINSCPVKNIDLNTGDLAIDCSFKLHLNFFNNAYHRHGTSISFEQHSVFKSLGISHRPSSSTLCA